MPKENKTLRTCKNGHSYYKSSDCPTCPVCEEERKPREGFMQLLAAPARRAMENNGIITLLQLSQFSETEILQLHGMGKTSIPILRKVLEENKLTFKQTRK
jgi:hypothetical protein